MFTIPEAIKNHPYGWILGEKWADMHHRQQMFSVTCCGAVGSGKSISMAGLGYLMDRTDGESRFSVDNIAFNAREFFDLIKKKHKIGTVIMLDDAGLAAYSGDALTREVKEISKIFQSFRSKRYCVLITLPVYTMLAKNVRLISQNYAESTFIDYANRQNILKFQQVFTDSKTGKSYFYRYIQKVVRPHFKFENLSVKNYIKRNFIKIDAPPKDVVKQYEEIKEERLGDYYDSSADRVYKKKKEKVSAAVMLNKRFAYIKENYSDYLDSKGRISILKILLNKEMIIPENQAREITKELNDEIESGELIRRK